MAEDIGVYDNWFIRDDCSIEAKCSVTNNPADPLPCTLRLGNGCHMLTIFLSEKAANTISFALESWAYSLQMQRDHPEGCKCGNQECPWTINDTYPQDICTTFTKP